MRGTNWGRAMAGVYAILCALLTGAGTARAQSAVEPGPSAATDSAQKVDLATVGLLLQQLQAQIQELNAQVKDLKIPQLKSALNTICITSGTGPSHLICLLSSSPSFGDSRTKTRTNSRPSLRKTPLRTCDNYFASR